MRHGAAAELTSGLDEGTFGETYVPCSLIASSSGAATVYAPRVEAARRPCPRRSLPKTKLCGAGLGGRNPTSVMLLVFVLLTVGSAAAQEEPSLAERREADCIDRYNDLKYVDPTEEGFRRNPFFVRPFLGIRPAVAQSGEIATASDTALGGTLDIASPVLFSQFLRSSGSTDLGLAVGALGSFWSVSNRSRDFEGELRMGISLRRFEPTWSSPPGIAPRCRRTRTDLGIDLLRWRVGSFTDLKAAGHPTVLTSSIGFPSGTVRYAYSTWGVSLSGSFFEFRVAPEFQLRTRGYFEYDLEPFAFRIETEAHWRWGWPSVLVGFLAGIDVQLGGG